MPLHNISTLPTEIIDSVLNQIDNGPDRASFSYGCRAFYESFSKALMRDIDVEFMVSSSNSLPCSSLPRNVANSWINGIRRVSVDGWTSKVREDRIQETPDADHHMKIACKKEECRACALAGTLGVLDRFLASQTNKMSKRPRSLTFRGKLGMRTQVMDRAAGDLEHRFIGAHGLAASTPQTFEVNMHWQYWDMAILSVFPMSQLSVLKVPIGIPADCEQLGRALVTMPLLKSLTIRDMADHPHFLKNYPFLGLGIRSRSATLKDLDLSMTNHNRPNFYDAWEHTVENERFVKPATLNYFFSAIFPLSMDDIHVNARQRYMKFEEQIKKKMSRPEDCTRLLSLAKLHLKRIDLPAWSFEKVLDGTNLKELRLQYCDVDKDVWPSIGSRMLVALENIDYELLRCKTFRHFLYSQSHLQSLSFARPPDQYRAAYLVFWTRDEVPTLLMELESQAPPLSQAWAMVSDANSGYPTSETFLNTLSKANIRNLLLPVDMYCISPNDIRGIGAFLPFLQQLTWGFDYGNPEIHDAFEQNFLPSIPSTLRKITFLSLYLPKGYNGLDSDEIIFNAPNLHKIIISLRDQVPQSIRYLRYQHLPDPHLDNRQTTTIYYHRRTPRDLKWGVNGEWWIELRDEGEKTFEEERTPDVLAYDRDDGADGEV